MNCLCELFSGRWKAREDAMHRGLPFEGQDPEEAGLEDYLPGPVRVADPLGGAFASPMTLTRSDAMPGEGPSELLQGIPFIRPTNLIGPTDRVTPQYPALALARGLQRVDVWTPVTDWQHNTGFLEVSDVNPITPLAEPRYSYAGMDTNEMLDEAKERSIRTVTGY